MLKKTMLAAACLALAACGGDDAPDPASRTFTYGAPVAAAPGSAESYAAEDGSFLLSDGASYRASGDPLDAETASGSLPMLADDMGSYVFDAGMVNLAPARSETKRLGAAVLGAALQGAALGEGFDNPGCVTASPGLVRYSGCTMTQTDMTSTMTMRVDGTFSRTADVFSWDATVAMTMDDVDFSMTSGNHLHGSITFGASTIVGQVRSDASVTASFDGQSLHAGQTTLADLDLQYGLDPAFCVTGGTLELRRVWTRRPTGATSADLPDQGAMFTWLGCGEVLVARSQ